MSTHTNPISDAELDAAELPIRGGVPRSALQLVWRAASGRYRRWYGVLVVGEALRATAGVCLPYAISRIVNIVVTDSASADPLTQAVLWFVVLSLCELVVGRLNALVAIQLIPRTRQYVARSLFHYLQRHSQRYLSDNFAGALASRISETATGVKNVLNVVVGELWPTAITLSVATYLLSSAAPVLGAFACIWAITFVSVSVHMAKRTQPLSHDAAEARSHTVGLTVDAVSNHSAVRLFARVDHERARLHTRYASELAAVLRADNALERVRRLQYGSTTLLKASVVVVAARMVQLHQITIGEFVMALSLALVMISEVHNVSRRFVDMFEWLGNAANGVRTIFGPHELTDSPDAREVAVVRGEVEFERVSFSYAQGKQVFRDLSVHIGAGEHVGVVGISGSGKSTFVSLLLRLYDPQAGTIRLDQHDLRSLKQDSLHQQIGLIPQDPTLFHRSLRDNIRYGKLDASDAEVERAAERARAHDFIREIPDGYAALVGERGVKLSGGQRQRIAIARVLLKNAAVLILDEATSSLDSITERAIQDVLNDAMTGKTVIVIAHRLSTIAHLDRILVFSEGRIVEDGSHAELVARAGVYHALWSRQSGGFLPDRAAHARVAAE